MTVAAEGEAADERIVAPPALRPLLGFSRLSATSYRTIARVIDEDGVFRARVAEAAPDEAVIGRVGWLWLHRPVDWLEEVAGADDAPAPAAGDGAGSGSGGRAERGDKLRRAAKDADDARRRAEGEAKELRRRVRELERALVDVQASSDRLEEERAAARRDAKAAEGSLSQARRELKMARSATRDAELELQRLRGGGGSAGAGDGDGVPSTVTPKVASKADDEQRRAAARDVAARARDAAELAAALDRLATDLDPSGSDDADTVPAVAPSVTAKGRSGGRSGRARGRRRSMPALPPGVFGATVEAHRHLIGDGANLVLVDGYNVARTGWSDLPMEEERRRVVGLLEGVQARSGATVVVVFDGDHEVVSPAASRTVRVRYSPAGITADDVIGEMVEASPLGQPIVVVSSDRAVASHARSRGAATIGSAAFLAAARR